MGYILLMVIELLVIIGCGIGAYKGSKGLLLFTWVLTLICCVISGISLDSYLDNSEHYKEQIEYYEDKASNDNKNRQRFGSYEMADAYSYKQEEWKEEANHYRKELRNDKALIFLGSIILLYTIIITIAALINWKVNPAKEIKNE